jgi:2-polyprenyl-6-methoxyphenol hydroxylase-like FAD-dependent oxidoreductase
MAGAMFVQCCIAGGGPAGMMLGLLLARAGVRTVVLEKHGDFLRDFRGDTVHPSTLEVIHELGLLDEFLDLPHQKATELRVHIGGREMAVADFRHLPTRCGFIAFMPQWDFLSFLADKASAYPRFELIMNAEVVDLLEDDGRSVNAPASRSASWWRPSACCGSACRAAMTTRPRRWAGSLPGIS